MTTQTSPSNQVVPPGEYLSRELLKRDIPEDLFACRISLHPTRFAKLLAGAIPLTPTLAARIALQLDTSAELWTGLERTYREEQGR